LSSPKVRHCHDRAWSPPRADYLDRPRPLHDDPIALSISAPYPVAARLVVCPDDFRDVGVGNQRYDTVALSGNGVGSEIDGGHYKSSSGPRFRLRASGPGPPQRAPISGARLAAPFVEALRRHRQEPGGCPWMRPLVVLSGLSGSCVGRLNNARSSGRVRKRSSRLSSAALYSGRCSASSSTAAPASILRRVSAVRSFCRSRPCSLRMRVSSAAF
jgi:hypothetical protein